MATRILKVFYRSPRLAVAPVLRQSFQGAALYASRQLPLTEETALYSLIIFLAQSGATVAQSKWLGTIGGFGVSYYPSPRMMGFHLINASSRAFLSLLFGYAESNSKQVLDSICSA